MKFIRAHLILPVIAIVVIVCVLVGRLEWSHYRTYGHFVSYGLHVDPVNRDAYIGIPGQTKMYAAKLSNYSFRSVTLPACDYMTDDLAAGWGTEFPYAVQRFDTSSNTWLTVADASGEWFCRPYPLGKVETHLVSKTLAPGASVEVMEGEATGARDPFRQGDLARFVLFTKLDKSGDWNTAIASVPFRIEDNVIRDEANPLRVKH
jgi:hypothetical protein